MLQIYQMSKFIDQLYADSPSQLQPDRQASTYRLSYEELRFQQTLQNSQKIKERQLVSEIHKISEESRFRDAKAIRDAEKACESILLLQIQIQRLRSIICENDGQMRRVTSQALNLENIYRIKLEQLKQELQRHFQLELVQQNQKNSQDLAEIKSIFITKIGTIASEVKEKEHQLQMKLSEIESRENKIKIYSILQTENQSKIQVKAKEIATLSKEKVLLLEKVEELQNFSEEQYKQKQRQKEENDEDVKQLERQNEELKRALDVLKANNDEMYERINTIDDRERQMHSMKEDYQLKVQLLEEELEKLKERRTIVHGVREDHSYHSESGMRNSPKDSTSKVQIRKQSIIHSKERIQLKNQKEFKSLEIELAQVRELLEDKKRVIEELENKIKSQAQKSSSGIQELQKKIDKKNSEIRQLEKRVERKDQQIREMDYQQRKWLDRLSAMESQLESVGKEWEAKEKMISQVYKSIENKYLAKMEQLSQEVEQKQEQVSVFKELHDKLLKEKAEWQRR